MEITIISAFVVLILIIIFLLPKKKNHRRNYSLGLKAAEEARILVKNKKFDEVEKKVKDQEMNDITQIIDHLALSLDEKDLLLWKEDLDSDLSKLTLGVFYLHLAWITRTHKLAKNVSQKKAEGFFDYLQLCEETFKSISPKSHYRPELESRKIRLYMSLSNTSLAEECFENVSKTHPDFLWPYIHYSELIQPKWGGDIKKVEQLCENLPNNFLIKSIVELKLILDSKTLEDNYFRNQHNDINYFASQTITRINNELYSSKPKSVHRYILYNYMEAISDDIGKNDLKKYQKLKGNLHTIYPYGLLG